MSYGDTILDRYEITGPTISKPMYLFVDQYNSAPYRVPVGFGCNGILYPQHYLENNEWVDGFVEKLVQYMYDH